MMSEEEQWMTPSRGMNTVDPVSFKIITVDPVMLYDLIPVIFFASLTLTILMQCLRQAVHCIRTFHPSVGV